MWMATVRRLVSQCRWFWEVEWWVEIKHTSSEQEALLAGLKLRRVQWLSACQGSMLRFIVLEVEWQGRPCVS